MSRVRGILERLRQTVFRRRADDELDEEIRFHIERETERLIRTGLTPEDARRRASRDFGSVLHVKEQVRIESGFPWVEWTLRDLRHAARGLRKSPGFTAAAVLTLALGIGATTSVYTVVDHVLLRPLPYPESEELVQIVEQNSPTNRWNLSVADVLGIEEMQSVFESFAALERGSMALTGRGRPEQIAAGRVTAEWFRTLGIGFEEGRGFLADEGAVGSAPVVVLGRAFRDRTFGPSESALGSSLTLDGVPHTVVGVLGPSWASLAGYEADVWPILQLETPTRRGPFGLRGVARLSDGVTIETARSDLDQVSQRLFPRWADGFRDATARLTPYSLQEALIGDVGANLWLVFAAVVGVLLIAVANVTNLLLVRGAARQPEMALRASLGATRFQIARQLLTEGLLLSVVGGLAGLGVAYGSVEILKALGPAVPRLGEIALDGPILAATAAVTLAAAVVCGMAPMTLFVSRGAGRALGGVRGSVREGSSGGTGPKGWLRSALVASEFAIAFPLLVGAVLLAGSLMRLQRVDPGYDPEGLVATTISLPSESYEGYPEIQEFWTETLRRVNELPSVSVAGVGTSLPPDAGGHTNNFDLLAQPVADGESEPVSVWTWGSPSFLEALGVPLVAGRMLAASDDGDAPAVAVVSRSWAARYAPGGAVGQRFFSGGDRSEATTVVGVGGDMKLAGLDAGDDAAVYSPFAQAQFRRARLLIRARGPIEDAVADVRTVLASMDATLPLADVETMPERMARAILQPRRWTILVGLFSVLGLILAAIGTYGVLSYLVGRQSREIGIRIALGANPRAVRGQVFGRGLSLAGVGIGIGLLVSLLGARWVRSVVFGVSPTSPAVLAAVGAALFGVALLACSVPAIRATRVDPIRALRAE